MGKRPSAKIAHDSNGQKASKRARATTDSKKNTKAPDECNANERKSLQFSWCSTYPGSLPSLISPSINKWNLKICSWNVNGLRAWLKAGGLEYVEEETPDILGIQETKCSMTKIPADANLSGYKTYWSSAQKEGYAGTGLYSKVEPIKVSYGIGVSNHDVEGRVITAEYEKFYLITAYVPNSGQGLVRLPYRQHQWDPAFLQYVKKLDAVKPVIVSGDLNVAHEEIDLANPATNHKSAGFTDQERENFTKFLSEANLVDTYRAFYPTRERAYTFWNYRQGARPKNTGWRLDYFVVSKRLMPCVRDQEIRCAVPGSDHCPIVLYLEI